MNKMNKREVRRYEDRLTALYDRLSSEVAGMVESVLRAPLASGEHDRLVSESSKKELVLEGNEEERLAEVVAALRRIEEDRFGVCERCSNPIAKERLDALPYAPLCIRCERKVETGKGLEAVA